MCIVVPPGASASPQLLLTGESFVRFLSDTVYALSNEGLVLLFSFERSGQSIILFREFKDFLKI